VSTPTEHRESTPVRAALWYSLLGGPIAWSAHLLASYPLVSVACQLGTTTPLHLVTAITAAIAAGAGLTGALVYRRVPRQSDAGLGNGPARARFMALAGTFAGAFFTFVILVEGLPPILHDPCLRSL
jgi:hypothetical protein